MKNLLKKDFGKILFEGKGKMIGTVIGYVVLAVVSAICAAWFVMLVFLNL